MGKRAIRSRPWAPGSRRPSPTRDAKAIYRAGLDAVRAGRAVHDRLRLERTRRGEALCCGRVRVPLRPGGRLIVVGAGKASSQMARAAERRLGRRIAGGCIVTQRGYASPCRRLEIREAGHPVPDDAGVAAAARIGEWVDRAGADDVVLCLISGGGSALMPAPAGGVSLADKRAVTDGLLRAGAPIDALNCVRKHLSDLKGGHLARRAAPARLVVLLVSDVVGDPLDVIASGPAFGDPTTFADARDRLVQYGVWDAAPPGVRRRIEAGIAGEVPDTPAPGNPLFRRVRHEIVANNAIALDAASARARALGYRTLILTRRLQGEAREAGLMLAAIAEEIRAEGRPLRRPACLLVGGETTVTVRGEGVGGRCQELALSFALHSRLGKNFCLLAAGTDGRDGPTTAAGAFVDGRILKSTEKQDLDARRHLGNNDSHSFLRPLKALISTGPTGTNVMDLVVLVVV